jgi:hypothetical protein
MSMTLWAPVVQGVLFLHNDPAPQGLQNVVITLDHPYYITMWDKENIITVVQTHKV